MEVHLHIGAHRTGSSRIQQGLRRSGGPLDAARVAVLTPHELRPAAAAETGALRAALGRWRRDDDVRARAAAALGAARDAGARRAVMSDENYSGNIERMLRTGVLYPDIADRLRRIAPVFADRPPQVFFAVRDYADLTASFYAHRVTRHPLPSFETFAAALAALPRRWPAIVADIRAALPRAEVTLWPFERMRGNVGAVLSLVAGVPGLSDPIVEKPRSLASPGAEAVAALNAMTGDRAGTLAERRAVAARIAASGEPVFDPWPAADRAALAAAYSEDLGRLAAMPGVTLAPLDPSGAEASGDRQVQDA